MRSDEHHRRSIRLAEHDYAAGCTYFLTLCTYEKANLFGEVENGIVRLNKIREIVQEEWLRTPKIRAEVELGDYVIMPNHFHPIVTIRPRMAAVEARGCTPSGRSEMAKDIGNDLSRKGKAGGSLNGLGSTTAGRTAVRPY